MTMRPARRTRIEVRARSHIHSSVRDVPLRAKDFRSEPYEVKLATLALLDARRSMAGPGFLSAAFAPSIALAAALITLFVSLSLAEYSSLSAAVLKLTDAKTGTVHGISNKAYQVDVGQIAQPLAIVVVVVILAIFAIVAMAWLIDKRRSTAIAWIRIFEAQVGSARRQSTFNAHAVLRAARLRRRP
jgi:hypothetical protein